jgi:hypothetical protein
MLRQLRTENFVRSAIFVYQTDQSPCNEEKSAVDNAVDKHHHHCDAHATVNAPNGCANKETRELQSRPDVTMMETFQHG